MEPVRPEPHSTGLAADDAPGRRADLDRWMARHPWHPRVTPYVVYLLLLPLVFWLRDRSGALFLPAYAIQCGLVAWLLWRYRRLMPELTLRFHWLALPVGVGVFLVWVKLGRWMAVASPIDVEDGGWNYFAHIPAGLAQAALVVKLLGMAVLVPLFEELFARSLLLRSFHRFRRLGIGVLQFLQDIPLAGEWLIHTSLGARAGRHPPVFGPEFLATPLGALSFCGVASSTVVFMLAHAPRDWPAAVICGVAYCLLLGATRKKGLGPVIWAHGITNALLWVYTLATNDWRFM